MLFRYNQSELEEIMRSFYTFSGIRFILFDAEYNRLISYPESDCEFCSLMKSIPSTKRRCLLSDRKSFKKCQSTDGLVIYECYAGLIEAAMALRENDRIIGYLMFGQIISNDRKDDCKKKLSEFCKLMRINSNEANKKIKKIVIKSSSEISAAATIMEACTSYILLKELITPKNDRIFESAKDYIENHLEYDISVSDLCKSINISRTQLYNVFNDELHIGIASYIKKRRLHKAKELLKTTDLPITEISKAVGFSDYNYFSRVYKNYYGKSPKKYRNRT